MIFVEISSILAELENDLDETQSLKLSLIEEQKRHKNTKQELEEIRRSSLIFSDSSSSGLFADYDSAPSDENEFVDYSPREQTENGSSQDEGHSSLFDPMQDAFQNSEPLTARNDDLEWEHEDGWQRFGSVDNIDTLSRRKSKRGSLLKLRKTSSLGRLNDCVRKKHDSEVRCRSGSGGKWSSEENLKQNNESSGSLNRRTREQSDKSISLENKVALLQKQLQEEHQKRLMSENEVAKLQIEKENLNEELEDTRDQLRLSHLNLYCQDDDYEDELYFDQADDPGDFTEPCNKTATLEGKMRVSPTHSDEAAACCSSPELLSQTERMRTTRLTESWRKLNSQFYELDEYDNEIEVELDPSNIMDALRRLKTYTNCLYNDILYERDELQCLKKRASRLENK